MGSIIAPPELTEYAVWYRLPGELEDRIEVVGSREIGAELIGDLKERHGARCLLMSRPVGEWQVAQ